MLRDNVIQDVKIKLEKVAINDELSLETTHAVGYFQFRIHLLLLLLFTHHTVTCHCDKFSFLFHCM